MRASRQASSQSQSEPPTSPALEPCQRPEPLPLSFAQQRLWFLDQWQPGSLYNLPANFRLRDAANRGLRLALEQITHRHEVLRTHFPAHSGSPCQRIDSPTRFTLPVDDLSLLPAELRQAECRAITQSEALTAFDLAAGPLWRARLLRLHEREHILLLTWHDTFFDGWSLNVLRPSWPKGTVPASKRGHADGTRCRCSMWTTLCGKENVLQGAALEQQLAYWQQQLKGLVPMELPTDRPRPPQQSYRGGALPVRRRRRFDRPTAEHGAA